MGLETRYGTSSCWKIMFHFPSPWKREGVASDSMMQLALFVPRLIINCSRRIACIALQLEFACGTYLCIFEKLVFQIVEECGIVSSAPASRYSPGRLGPVFRVVCPLAAGGERWLNGFKAKQFEHKRQFREDSLHLVSLIQAVTWPYTLWAFFLGNSRKWVVALQVCMNTLLSIILSTLFYSFSFYAFAPSSAPAYCLSDAMECTLRCTVWGNPSSSSLLRGFFALISGPFLF